MQPVEEETGMAEPEEELKALCPNVDLNLLKCPTCFKFASRWRLDRTYTWARVLYCSCGKDWAVCAFCTNSATVLVNTKQMYAHNYSRRHRNERKRPPPSPTQEESAMKKTTAEQGVLSSDPGEEEQWVQTRNSPMKEKKEESLLYPSNLDDDERKVACKLFHSATNTSLRDFGNPQSTAYFNADINGSGIADIVAKCDFQLPEVGKRLHESDVQYATDMAQFVHGLTHSQRNSLSRLLASTVAKVDRDSRTKSWKTTIPTNPVVMRNQVWEGKNALLWNIPCPPVHTLASHAYTSVRDCIRDRLAFGFPLEKVELREDENAPVRTLMQSRSSQRVLRKCQDLYNEPVLVLFLKEWQDGYDPHAMSKKNRGSCWVKVVTISEPHDDRNSAQVSFWRLY